MQYRTLAVVRGIAVAGYLMAQAAPATAAEACDARNLIRGSDLMGTGTLDMTERWLKSGNHASSIAGPGFNPIAVFYHPSGPVVTMLSASEWSLFADFSEFSEAQLKHQFATNLSSQIDCGPNYADCETQVLEGDVIGFRADTYGRDKQGRRTRIAALAMVTPPKCIFVSIIITLADGPSAAPTWRRIEADLAKQVDIVERNQGLPFWDRN